MVNILVASYLLYLIKRSIKPDLLSIRNRVLQIMQNKKHLFLKAWVFKRRYSGTSLEVLIPV